MTCVRRSTPGPTAALAIGLGLIAPGAQLAQAQDSVAAVASDQSTDRTARLIAGAKKEGALTVYSSLPNKENRILVDAIQKKYGIKVSLWRASSEDVLNRSVAERNGGRFDVDIMMGATSGIEPLHREQLLQEVKSPVLADIVPQAIAPHREWVDLYLNTIVQAYNTNQVKKEDLPKTYADLADPRWKGRLTMEADDFDWFAEVVRGLGEEKGLALFRAIVAKNGISLRKGHTLLTNLTAAGEVPLALTVYGYSAEQTKRRGAPLDWFTLNPALARGTGIALAKRAPHPHAAVLFYDYVLGEAQAVFAKRDFVTTNRKYPSEMGKRQFKIIDSAYMLENADKWQKLYKEIVVQAGR